jgi:hypothetical protein
MRPWNFQIMMFDNPLECKKFEAVAQRIHALLLLLSRVADPRGTWRRDRRFPQAKQDGGYALLLLQCPCGK